MAKRKQETKKDKKKRLAAEKAKQKRQARLQASGNKSIAGSSKKAVKTGHCPTLQECHNKPNRDLQIMLDNKHPGWQNAQKVLETRTDKQRAHQAHQTGVSAQL